MKAIISYLDNMFAALPKTKQMSDLQEVLLSNMEDKYNELKKSGKTEKEAIGIVISEFGSIDELIKEFDIKIEDDREELPVLTEDDVHEYLQANKKSGRFMGLGVFLCILGSSLLIFINQLINDGLLTFLSKDAGNRIGLIILFLFIAAALVMMIQSAMLMDSYKRMNNIFEIPVQVRYLIEKETKSFHSSYVQSLIIGLVLCALSPVALFLTPAMMYGAVVMLLVISIAAYIFVYYGWNQISYKRLLEINEHKKNQHDKVKGILSGALWMFITAVFIVGILSAWKFSWVVFIFGAAFQVLIEAYFQSKSD